MAKQRYRFMRAWDEDGVHGYEWRWTVPATKTTVAYDEVCVASAEDYWAGRDTFGYYMSNATAGRATSSTPANRWDT